MLFYVLYKQVYPLQTGYFSRFIRGIFGGGEENRTPVRKPIPTAFYERRRSIGFPIMRAGRQAHITGSL